MSSSRSAHHHCRCFRAIVVTLLATIILALIASAPVSTSSVSDTVSRKCIEVKDDYDLRQAARNSNVFLIVHEQNNQEVREYICKKLEATPEKRVLDAVEKGRGAIFAYLEIEDPYEDSDGIWHDGNRNFAKNSLALTNFPSYVFLSKGMNGNSKYASHVTQLKGQHDSLELTSEVEKFIEKNVGYKIGNDVYNIIFFDTVVAQFVSYGDASGLNWLKQRFLALIVRTSTLFSFKEPFATLGQLYNRAFSMSLKHGLEYSETQIKKLERKIHLNGGLSEEEKHEIRQKIAILKSFSEPKELTPRDVKQMYFHAMLHVGLIVATILLFVAPRDDSESTDADGEEKAINDVPIIARPVD